MKSIRKPQKRKVRANGGPWDGKVLLIDSGTMVISVGNEWHGRYNEKGVWHDVREAD